MKHLLNLFAIILICNLCHSQIVDIPDANFKNVLLSQSPPIDSNGDGEIQFSEAASTLQIIAQNSNISDLTGIEAFVNLEILQCRGNAISSIDISNLSFLESLDLSTNSLNELDVTNNPNLLYLYCDTNPLSLLDLSNNEDLLRLDVSITEISELDFSTNPSLESIAASDTAIQAIEVSSLPNLGKLSVFNTQISSIDISSNSELEILEVNGTMLDEVSLDQNSNLRVLRLSNTNISNLDLTFNPLLELLSISSTDLNQIDLSSNPNLKILDISYSNLDVIDLSGVSNICSLFAYESPLLKYVNLRNGNNLLLDGTNDCSVSTNYGSFGFPNETYFLNSSSLEFICVDDVIFAEENFNDIPEQTVLIEDCSLSVSEIESNSTLIYPNPTQSELNIKNDRLVNSVEIYSVNGKRLFTTSINTKETKIDFSQYTAGIYFIKIISSGVVETQRLIKL